MLSTIRHFRDEYEAHIRDKHCRAGVCAALVNARCSNACPANVDIPGFVSLVGEKRYAEALRLHRERNPLRRGLRAASASTPARTSAGAATLDDAGLDPRHQAVHGRPGE